MEEVNEPVWWHGPLAVIVFMGIASLFAMFGYMVGKSAGAGEERERAIKAGVAHWEADIEKRSFFFVYGAK